MTPREFKNYDNTKLGTDHQSVQSVAGKVSCNNTALYSVAPAPKLSGTEKLLPRHHLTQRRSLDFLLLLFFFFAH